MTTELCRICLDTTDLCYIYENTREENLSMKIMKIANVKIYENDTLPSFVCHKCVEKLENFIKFKHQIEKTSLYLQKLKLKQEQKQNQSNNKENRNIELTENSIRFYNNNPIENNDVENGNIEIVLEVQKTHTDISEKDIRCDKIKNSYLETEENSMVFNSNSSNTVSTDSKQKSRKYLKTKSSKLNQFQCNICGKLLSSKYRLQCHMRIHTGERPFECLECSKKFSIAYNLKIHKRVHTGEKPLQCDICMKKFAQPSGLISHIRLHTGEMPYECNLCRKKFKTKSHLKYHIRGIHTDEKNHICKICKKAFITKQDLKQHENIHTNEKLYICNICGLQLKRLYHLLRHMSIHTGEKNFICEICNAAFAQKYDLKRHQQTHSKTDIKCKN